MKSDLVESIVEVHNYHASSKSLDQNFIRLCLPKLVPFQEGRIPLLSGSYFFCLKNLILHSFYTNYACAPNMLNHNNSLTVISKFIFITSDMLYYLNWHKVNNSLTTRVIQYILRAKTEIYFFKFIIHNLSIYIYMLSHFMLCTFIVMVLFWFPTSLYRAI